MVVYVITGSTSGIGEKLVESFSAQGVTIFAGYRNSEKLPLQIPDNVTYFYMDMSDRNSITQAAEFIKFKTDKIDVLINVAGSVTAGPIECIDTDRLRKQFDVNVFSHIEFSQKLLDLLEGGRIINISSMASFGNFPFVSPYCASKRALDIFFNAFAIENHHNIKVISIKPGVIATPIWEKSVEANMKYFDDANGYAKELEFVKNNALKNTSCGLPVEKVTQLVTRVAKIKNPKCSYTIGNDAKFAQILSLLPQDLVNNLVKFGMKCRIK